MVAGVLLVAVSGCADGWNIYRLVPSERKCVDFGVFVLDRETYERIVGAEVSVVLTDDLQDRSAEEWLADSGVLVGVTDDDGSVTIEECGTWKPLDFVNSEFTLDDRFAVLGVRRSEDGPLETVVVEFEKPTPNWVSISAVTSTTLYATNRAEASLLAP